MKIQPNQTKPNAKPLGKTKKIGREEFGQLMKAVKGVKVPPPAYTVEELLTIAGSSERSLRAKIKSKRMTVDDLLSMVAKSRSDSAKLDFAEDRAFMGSLSDLVKGSPSLSKRVAGRREAVRKANEELLKPKEG